MNTSQFSQLSHALTWVNSISNLQYKNSPRQEKLIRIQQVLQLLNNPHSHYKSIHIAGSKGKTSTAFACSYFLKTANKKVGLFTSPHIHSYNERIQIDHKPIQDELFLSVLNTIYSITQKNNISLTMFEILTACAAEAFKIAGVEYAVFEVGIGGKYDTTNFLQAQMCIITNIEKEHTSILGNTINQIAIEKSGIIKNNAPVWIGSQYYSEALDTIRDIAQHNNAPHYYLPELVDIINLPNEQNTHLTVVLQCKNTTIYPISHWHNVQVESHTLSKKLIENQILADFAIQSILDNQAIPNKKEYPIQSQPYCRSEILQDESHKLFLDGAHTAQSIDHALETITTTSNIILIIGLSIDKDIPSILQTIAKYHTKIITIIISKSTNSRNTNPIILYEQFKEKHNNITLEDNIYHALDQAKILATQSANNVTTCVVGSFYICADAREWWNTTHTKNQ